MILSNQEHERFRKMAREIDDLPERLEAIKTLEANRIAFEAAWEITVTEIRSDFYEISDIGREMSKKNSGYFTLTRQGDRPSTVGSIIRESNWGKDVHFYVVANNVTYYDHDRLCDFDMDDIFEPGYITEVSVVLLKKKQ